MTVLPYVLFALPILGAFLACWLERERGLFAEDPRFAGDKLIYRS